MSLLFSDNNESLQLPGSNRRRDVVGGALYVLGQATAALGAVEQTQSRWSNYTAPEAPVSLASPSVVQPMPSNSEDVSLADHRRRVAQAIDRDLEGAAAIQATATEATITSLAQQRAARAEDNSVVPLAELSSPAKPPITTEAAVEINLNTSQSDVIDISASRRAVEEAHVQKAA